MKKMLYELAKEGLFELLKTIYKLSNERDQIATPTNIIERFYEKDLKNIENVINRKSIIDRKRSIISRKLTKLMHIGVVDYEIHETDPRKRLYFVNPKGIEALKDECTIKRIKNRIAAKENGLSIGVFHNHQIRKLIGQMIYEFPVIGRDELYIKDPPEGYPPSYHGEDLPVERTNVLFKDLENHLLEENSFISFSELNDLLDQFKNNCVELEELESKIEKYIIKELENKLNIQHNPSYGKLNSFDDNLTHWFLKGLEFRSEESSRSYFKHYYIDVSIHQEEVEIENKGAINIKIGGSPMITVEKNEHSEDKIQHIEKTIKELLSNIEDLPCYKEYNKRNEIIKELKDIREKIIIPLEKEKERERYPGDCPYIN